jgi:hypothetical protein
MNIVKEVVVTELQNFIIFLQLLVSIYVIEF